MDKKQAMKRAAGWLLVIGVLVVLVVLVPLTVSEWDATTAEWSQAIIQALAALGGLWFWLYRSRPRVVLRLKSSDGLYLELVNVGSRAAKKVEMRVDPPIPWETTLGLAPREQFGPVEDFGDMDQGQRYVVLVGSPVPHTVDVLNATTFVVSHESTWGFRRRKSTRRFGGSGGRSDLGVGAATPIGAIAETVKNQGQTLEKIEGAIQAVGRRLPAPAEEDEAGD